MFHDALAWVHPVMAAATLLLCFVVLRKGLKLRGWRNFDDAGHIAARKRHSALGHWSIALLAASMSSGLISAVALRGWVPLATWHGRLGTLLVVMFGVVGFLGRNLLAKPHNAKTQHGMLGMFALFLSAVAALQGIALLP